MSSGTGDSLKMSAEPGLSTVSLSDNFKSAEKQSSYNCVEDAMSFH